MGRAPLDPGEGLVISPCESVHTCWVRFAIDVVFIDVEDRVLKVFPGVRPFRFRLGGWEAHSVVEGPTGMIERSGTEIGHELLLEEPA